MPNRFLKRIYLVLITVLLLGQGLPAHAKTIVVGPGEPIESLQQAAKLVRNGDTIELKSAQYRGQPIVWQDLDITIRGIGQRPVMVADGVSAEGKAIWVVRNAKLQIENLEFRGARVASGNGAGIRFESGELTVRRCAFFDNEMGILTGNDPLSVLEVQDSEFGEAPLHDSGALHHLLYAGTIHKLTVTGSRFLQGFRGHLIKSRARSNHIYYNMVRDSAQGQASYELEFPNGGVAFVVGNIVGQSEKTGNLDLISYGAEGQRWAENALYLSHNTLLNPLPGGRYARIWSEKFTGKLEAWAVNNLTIGYGDLPTSSFDLIKGNYHVDQAISSSTDDLSTLSPSVRPALGYTVTATESVRSRGLSPTLEFHWPVGTRPVAKKASLFAGALQ